MAWNYYHDQDEKESVRRQIEKRRSRGETFEQLTVPSGSSKLVKTFWATSWCRHLEEHSDYEHRLPRGRSYLRQGNVYNLAIEPGRVTASVAGSSLYEVTVTIKPLEPEAWAQLKADCAGQVASLLDLLSGRLGEGVLRAIADPQRGLFPKPRQIHFSCTCPDHADMCKHVAAVLYGVGVQLDTKPDLFFVLRSVDPSELLSGAANETLTQAHGTDAELASEDLSALFGIELNAEPPRLEPTPDAVDSAEEPATKEAQPGKRRLGRAPLKKRPEKK